MHLIDRLFKRVSRFPELANVEPDDRKLAVSACRWKFLKYWQIWVAFIVNGLIGIIFVGAAGIWLFNYYFRAFNQLLISLLTLLSMVSFLVIIYVSKKIDEYFLAPCVIMALPEGADTSEVNDQHARLQQLRKKAIKKGIWFLAVCFPTVVVFGAIVVRNPSGSMAALKMPERLKSPRIVENMAGVTRKLFLEDNRLGHLTDIAFRKGSDRNSDQMILAGTKGALFTIDGITSIFVAFSPEHDHVDYIRLDSLGTYGFMNRGSWCSQARVMDEAGRPLWSYGAGSPGVDDMASGDIDGDGNPKYVIGFNGGGGIHLLDNSGRKLWEYADGNVWHVEIADIGGNRSKVIVHSNARGEITVRDSQGKVISKSRPSPYFAHFSLIRWPNPNSPEQLLLSTDDAIWIFDTNAKVLAKFQAPDVGTLGYGRGTLLASENGKHIFGTIVDFHNWDRSILYLHDPSGKLIYQEIMPESCRSISVLTAGKSLSERLVIGCKGKLLEYRMTGRTR